MACRIPRKPAPAPPVMPIAGHALFRARRDRALGYRFRVLAVRREDSQRPKLFRDGAKHADSSHAPACLGWIDLSERDQGFCVVNRAQYRAVDHTESLREREGIGLEGAGAWLEGDGPC